MNDKKWTLWGAPAFPCECSYSIRDEDGIVALVTTGNEDRPRSDEEIKATAKLLLNSPELLEVIKVCKHVLEAQKMAANDVRIWDHFRLMAKRLLKESIDPALDKLK